VRLLVVGDRKREDKPDPLSGASGAQCADRRAPLDYDLPAPGRWGRNDGLPDRLRATAGGPF